MNRCKYFVLLSLLSWCLTLPFATQAASAPSLVHAFVGRTQGILAVRDTSQATWRVLPVGGILPDLGEAQTSGDGPAQIFVSAECSLFLGPTTRIQFNLTTRHVQLLSGRVFCSASNDPKWTVVVRETQIEATGNGVEVAFQSTDTDEVLVTVSQGAAKVIVPGTQAVALTTNTIQTWRRNQAGAATKLTVDQQQSLAAWTKPLPPGQGPGQLVITDPQSHSRTRLAIARYHAELILSPPTALVKLDQAFFNPSGRQEEGEFVFNLPPGASVSRFAMFVTPTDLVEGEIIDRRTANTIYSRIVSRQRDPAILEQIGDNLFKMRVFPIFAQDVKRILLDYTLPLDGQSGQYHLQLPMLSDLEPIWDFRLRGTVHGPTTLASVQSPTHPEIQFAAPSPDRVQFDFTSRQYQPKSDFMLAFHQTTLDHPTTFRRLNAEPLKLKKDPQTTAEGLFFLPGPNETLIEGKDRWNETATSYFLAELPNPSAANASAPADVLILLETSSAMKSLEQLRPALTSVIQNLRTGDRIRLVCADSKPRPLHPGWLKPGDPGIRTALSEFEKQFCIGANDMLATCESVSEQFEIEPQASGTDSPSARRRVTLYLGAGQDTATRGPQATQVEIMRACLVELKKANTDFWAVELVGSENAGDPNKQTLLQSLTEQYRGRRFKVADKPLERSAFFEWVLSGFPSCTLLTDVFIASADPMRDELATDLYFNRNTLPGVPLRVTGRISPTHKLRVQYRVQTHQGPSDAQEVVLHAGANATDHLVGRYWAEQRYAHLNSLLAGAQKNPQIQAALDAIVRLSREWTLLNPHTAFLVLENEQEYLTWNVPRQARRRYWSETGLPPVAPLPANWIVSVAPPKVLKNLRLSQPLASVPPDHPLSREQVQKQILLARKALADGHLETAERALDEAGRSLIEKNPEYIELLKELDQAKLQSRTVQDFGQRRSWFELRTRPTLPLNLDQLLSTTPVLPPWFLKLHPHAEALFREVDLPEGELSVDTLASWLQTQTGIKVLVNRRALEEASIPSNTSFAVPSLKKLTLFTALPLILEKLDLTYLEHSHSIEILPLSSRDDVQKRILFPVQDLLSPQPRFNMTELNDPLLDRYAAFEQQVAAKLRQVVPLKLTDGTLQELANVIRKQLDINVSIKTQKLEEESISTEAADVTFDSTSMPFGDALKWILNEKQLNFYVRDEVLVITTRTDLAGRMETRVYPAMGLVHRSKTSPEVGRTLSPWAWGSNGMGLGGFGGFGGGFGGMGGFGGFGGAGGGFGGAMGGGGLGGGGSGPPTSQGPTTTPAIVNTPANAPPSGISEIPNGPKSTPSDSNSATTRSADKTPQAEPQNDDSAPGTDRQSLPANDAESHMAAIMKMTGQNPAEFNHWMQTDGEGGDIAFFAPSLSFAIRHTEAVHQEIQDYFHDLRELQAKEGVQPNSLPLRPRDVVSPTERIDPTQLMSMIMQVTGGADQSSPWMQIDGEGGDLSWDEPRCAIHVKHSARVIDEIQRLLIRLRRERYAGLYGTRPWTHHRGSSNLSLSLIPAEWDSKATTNELSERSRQFATATPEELKILQIRRQDQSGSWSWTDMNGRKQATLALQTAGNRLKVTWPGREIRVSEQTAVALAPQLHYAEIGPWGDAVREWLDVEIPCWPHRSNHELAELFEITRVSTPKKAGSSESLRTLRFVPNAFHGLTAWIEITYDGTTGLPVEWSSSSGGKVIRKFLITNNAATRELVCHSGTDGVGRWLPAAETVSAAEISTPTDLAANMIVFDRRPGAATKTENPAFIKFREGNFSGAAKAFQELLAKDPGQPLAKFLLAWSLDQQNHDVPNERVQAAFVDAIRSGPPELGTFIAHHGARRLSPREIFLVLSQKPTGTRSFEDEFQIGQWLLTGGFYEAAAEQASQALELKTASEAESFDLIKLLVTAQLRQSNLDAAIATTEHWIQGSHRPVTQVRMLLDLFEGQGQAPQANRFYLDLLQRPDVQKLPPADRRELSLWHAQAIHSDDASRPFRWAALLDAIELLPRENAAERRQELTALIKEMRSAPEATPENVAKLIERSHTEEPRRALLSVQADHTTNARQATEIDWKLHQMGYHFEDNLQQVLIRMNESNLFEKTIAIAEAHLRSGKTLELYERELLAGAYQKLNQSEAANRVLSTP